MREAERDRQGQDHPASGQLVPFLIRHAIGGCVVGWTIMAAFIYLDIGRLGQLLAAAEDWPLVLLLMGMGFAVTFGSLAMGTAIFLLPRR